MKPSKGTTLSKNVNWRSVESDEYPSIEELENFSIPEFETEEEREEWDELDSYEQLMSADHECLVVWDRCEKSYTIIDKPEESLHESYTLLQHCHSLHEATSFCNEKSIEEEKQRQQWHIERLFPNVEMQSETEGTLYGIKFELDEDRDMRILIAIDVLCFLRDECGIQKIKEHDGVLVIEITGDPKMIQRHFLDFEWIKGNLIYGPDPLSDIDPLDYTSTKIDIYYDSWALYVEIVEPN